MASVKVLLTCPICTFRAFPSLPQKKDRELASKYYHSTHVSVSPRITQVAVIQDKTR
jgi:hypothetical protein